MLSILLSFLVEIKVEEKICSTEKCLPSAIYYVLNYLYV